MAFDQELLISDMIFDQDLLISDTAFDKELLISDMIFDQELLISDTIFEQELLISDIEFDQELLISPTACDQAPFCCLCCREHERSLIVCRASPGMATVLNQEPRVLIIQLSLLLAESFVLRIATSFQSSPRRIGFKYSQRPCSQ